MSFTQPKFVVYVDESGDHGLRSIDPTYPVFVLAFCVFEREDYVRETSASVQRLKFDYFHHDMVVLHEREIRKALGPFSILKESRIRDAFMVDLNGIVERAPMTLVACCIRKDELQRRYSNPDHVYHLAMRFGLERIHRFLQNCGAAAPTFFVCERRGRREDAELELEFRRFCSGANDSQSHLPFEIVLADKKINSAGLQLADLVARPIGRKVLAPDQPNRAFDVLAPKFARGSDGDYLGYGLEVFPSL